MGVSPAEYCGSEFAKRYATARHLAHCHCHIVSGTSSDVVESESLLNVPPTRHMFDLVSNLADQHIVSASTLTHMKTAIFTCKLQGAVHLLQSEKMDRGNRLLIMIRSESRYQAPNVITTPQNYAALSDHYLLKFTWACLFR